MKTDALNQAIALIPGGIRAVAERTGLSYEAVRKWTKVGLPRTEWTGETAYSKAIAAMQDRYTVDHLLAPKTPSEPS